jgi:glucose-1-phosphatase
MTRISLALFDMNDVLCRYDKAARVACLARLSGRQPDTVEAAIWKSGYEDLGDAGLIDANEYLRGFGERIGCKLTLDEWTAALKVGITPVPEVLALVKRMKVRTGVLTNNNMLTRQQIDVVFPELRAVFADAIHVSAEFQTRKPEPEVYRRCVAACRAEPETTLFVDDSPANIAGAEQAGLQGHRYTTVVALADTLKRYHLV